ncbi:MAG: hypothetical protein WCD38_03110 [Candidatus Tumulicola sp.]
MTWIYAIPPWLLFISVIVASAAVAGAGLLLVRRIVPQSDELSHNDVAGPIIGTVGTILAVILSFLLVMVWQEYDGAAATVAQEAGAVADLYHIGEYLPGSPAKNLRTTLKRYIDVVIDQEWPAMRFGRESMEARTTAFRALSIVAHYQPRNSAEQSIQQSGLGLATTFIDARRDRLFANQQGIPVFFWAGNFILAAITIGFCFIFRVRKVAVHLVMTIALTTVIATIFVLIALFDYPFRGDTQIPPTVFISLRQALNGEAIVSSLPSEPVRSQSSSAR